MAQTCREGIAKQRRTIMYKIIMKTLGALSPPSYATANVKVVDCLLLQQTAQISWVLLRLERATPAKHDLTTGKLDCKMIKCNCSNPPPDYEHHQQCAHSSNHACRPDWSEGPLNQKRLLQLCKTILQTRKHRCKMLYYWLLDVLAQPCVSKDNSIL